MVPTMAPSMQPGNAHKDIPGNPSTAKSSATKLNNLSNGKPFRVLTDADWNFWINNGYIVIKNAYEKNTLFCRHTYGVLCCKCTIWHRRQL